LDEKEVEPALHESPSKQKSDSIFQNQIQTLTRGKIEDDFLDDLQDDDQNSLEMEKQFQLEGKSKTSLFKVLPSDHKDDPLEGEEDPKIKEQNDLAW
jgi:hypothetical protein